MNLPYFYTPFIDPLQKQVELDEDNSRHIIQVLRMKKGEKLQLTDGTGNLLSAEIVKEDKKKCLVSIQETWHKTRENRKITVAISLLKNTSRFEWFLEKAAEIGISEIIPLICDRTEKQQFRFDRLKNILISAMLQSQQVWLTVLQPPLDFKKLVEQSIQDQKFIAHCAEDAKTPLGSPANTSTTSQIVLIGPEGDFTKKEIDLAEQYHFLPVTLGKNRLRTETAGIVAAIRLT